MRNWTARFCLGLGLFSLAAASFGFDSYQINIPANVMKGDPDVSFSITPYNGASPELVPHNVIINFPSGVSESPLADAPSGLDWSSVGTWGLFANNSASAGSVPVTVKEASAVSPVTTTKNFNLGNVVRSFEILPLGPVSGTAGTAFSITIRARTGLNGGGDVAYGFNDNVTVSASTGDVVVNGGGNVVSGADFVNGEATVSVMLRGTDPDTHANRITVTATINYFSLGLATGFADVSIDPGEYDHVVLLFPGETLVPGRILIGSGKSGASTPATASVAVGGGVRVYLVDQFNNPILTPPSPVTLVFDSLSHPTDTVPGLKVINSGNTVLVNGEFIFYRSGETHQVRVRDMDVPARESQSGVLVNSGAPNLIEVSAIPSPRLPGQAFTVSARVVDGTVAANTVTSYPNNRLVTLTLTNCAGAGLGTGTLDTSSSTPGVQTTVTFTGGTFNAPIVVYPKTVTACVKFDDGFGNVGESPSFQISYGDQLHLHVVMPGQTFTPGQAPGNTPATPPTQTAGTLISADVYVVDQGWNVVNNVTGGWTPDAVVVSLENSAGSAGYVDLTAANPTMPSSGNHATATGIRLRTAYPGNPDARLVAHMSGLSGRSDAFTINPNAYSQMVFVAPGEQLAPGVSTATEVDGKTGLPSDVAVNQNASIRVYLTDTYFNPIINPPLAGSAWPTLTFSSLAPPSANVTFPFTNPFPLTSSLFANQVVFGTIGANTLRVVDNSPTAKSKNQTINVTPGSVTRFVVTPTPASSTADAIPLQSAGVPFLLTFKAFDTNSNIATNFSGTVYLQLWEDGAPLGYTGTLSPSTVTFVADPVTGGVVSNVPVTVTYAGKSLGSGADNLQVRAFVTSPTLREGFSTFFSVEEAPSWTDVVVTLPGEQLRPGLGAPYKANVPTSVVAGNSFPITVTAVDAYGNRVNQSAVVDLSVPTAGVFSSLGAPPQITLSNGLGSGVGHIFTAATAVLRASVTANGFSDSSTVTVTPGSYAAATGRLILLAPGEVLLPGSTLGKDSGLIQSVEANTALSFQLRACDAFYNIDTSYSGNSVSLTSDDDAIHLSGIALNNGVGTVNNVFLKGHAPNPSVVEVTATEPSNTTKTSSSDLTVTPGASYEITVPTGAAVGGAFSMTVRLLDPVTALPVAGANHSIALEAMTPAGDAATVPLSVTVATLANGEVTFLQSYSDVETIQIWVTDSYNRLAKSQNISVVPNELMYKITLPAVPQTTDDIFPVTVGLYDRFQDALPIRAAAYQHSFSVWVEVGGSLGAGATPLASAILSGGEATFNFSYTKAEHIVVRASGTVAGYPLITGLDDMDIGPGAYVKLQLIAPGEVAVPGVPSPTGKNSSGLLSQASREPFSVLVNAVDRYWNTVTSLQTNSASPTVQLTASDGSLTTLPAQGFSGGQSLFSSVRLTTPPEVTLTVADSSSTELVPQSVSIPLSGRAYGAVATSPWFDFYSGPTRTFDVDLSLYRFFGGSTGTLVSGYSGHVFIEPLTPDFQPLPVSNLVVVSPALSDPAQTNRVSMDPSGLLNLTLGYRVAEDIRLRFRDEEGWEGHTDVLHFVPRDVEYVATTPAESPVGPPGTFSMTITPRDKDTGNTAKNWTQTVSITPVSPSAATVGGTLQVGSVLVNGGANTFQQAFSQSGVFYFLVSDGVRSSSSSAMNFLPGLLASMSTDLPLALESGSTRTVHVTLLDAFSNPIPNRAVTFSLADPSFGVLSTLTGVSDVLGRAAMDFFTNNQKSGASEFRARSGSVEVLQPFRLMGPPTTSIRLGSRGVEESQGYALKPGDPIYFDVDVASGTTLVGVGYSLNGGTVTTVSGPFETLSSGKVTFGPLPPFTTPGAYTLEYFGIAETSGGTEHTETTKTSKTFFVSAPTTPEEGLVNYPNPFRAGRERTFLEYNTDVAAGAHLAIYDMMGQKVFEKSFSQWETNWDLGGLSRVAWDGRNNDGVIVGNGGYVALLEVAGGGTLKRKIAVKK